MVLLENVGLDDGGAGGEQQIMRSTPVKLITMNMGSKIISHDVCLFIRFSRRYCAFSIRVFLCIAWFNMLISIRIAQAHNTCNSLAKRWHRFAAAGAIATGTDLCERPPHNSTLSVRSAKYGLDWV